MSRLIVSSSMLMFLLTSGIGAPTRVAAAPRLGATIATDRGAAEVHAQFVRPLAGKERAVLKRLGVRFYGVVSAKTYLVKVDAGALEDLQAHPLIQAIQLVAPEDKLTRDLHLGSVGSHVVNADGTWSASVRFYEDVKLKQALEVLDEHGVRVPARGRLQYNEQLAIEATHEQILSLANEPAVRSIEQVDPQPETNNLVSQQLSNVDNIQAAPFNLNGMGVILGIWDGGPVRANHPDLNPRVTVVENDQGASGHATHVAGTMISSGANNANAEGMAPAAGQLFSYDFGDNTTTEQNDAVNNNNIVISNHSWGTVIGWNGTNQTGNQGLFGSYNATARDWDDLVQTTGLIVVKSSGNDRNDCNPNPPFDCDGVTGGDGQQYDTIGTHGNAKNVITVGAINDDGTTSANFSSSGPADDGRIKPDVVANGVTLTSTCDPADTAVPRDCPAMGDYGSLSGTSMSTPSVSGIVADLVQRYRAQLGGADPPAEVVKALLVNTAVDLGRPGPDYLFGHGLVDALAAVNTIDVGEVRILTNAVDQGDVDEYRIGVPSGLARLRVTANWIDPEGAASNAANDIVNDLDLEAIAPDGTVFFPFSGPGMANPANNATVTGANAVDTVENLQVGAPAPGFWRIRVRGTAVPDGPQNYAIVSNASFLLPDQPDIRVNAPLDFDTTCEGEFQDIPVTIFNIGGADLLVHSVSVASGADFSVLPNPTQPFVVQPGAHVDVTVRFSPSSPGAKLGVLEIASNDADESVLALDMTGRGGTGDVNATIEANGDFGDVALGSFGLLTLQVLNQGTCNLELTNVSRVAGSADFSIGSGGGFPTFPLVLGAGSHVEIPIRFEPSSFGLKGATFRVQSDDPDDPIIDVGVIGNSPPSDLRVSGSTEFGEVCAGVLAEQVLDICNVGLSDLVVSSVAFDPPCDDFTLVNNPFPANVSHDFCMPLTIRYTPTEAGDHECTLTIITNDPDAPATTVTVTGSTPTASIDVPPDQGFPATVIQGVGSCESRRPFPVSNTGSCPLEIVDVALGGPSPAEYALSGLPSFPIFLESGGVIGEGDLKILFQPDVVDRDREATLAVTYTSDPITGATETVTRALCGEGVFTGARVLVTVGGSPVATVEQIHLQRINANRNKDRLDTVSVLKDVPLTNVTPAAPCPPFAYHAEFGTVANQIQLLPGAYQVTATVRVGQRRLKQVVGFDVNTCGFNPTVVVPF